MWPDGLGEDAVVRSDAAWEERTDLVGIHVHVQPQCTVDVDVWARFCTCTVTGIPWLGARTARTGRVRTVEQCEGGDHGAVHCQIPAIMHGPIVGEPPPRLGYTNPQVHTTSSTRCKILVWCFKTTNHRRLVPACVRLGCCQLITHWENASASSSTTVGAEPRSHGRGCDSPVNRFVVTVAWCCYGVISKCRFIIFDTPSYEHCSTLN